MMEKFWLIDLNNAEVYCQRVRAEYDSVACNDWCEQNESCQDPACRLLHFCDAEAADAPVAPAAPMSPRPGAANGAFVPYTYYALFVGNIAWWPMLLDLFLRGHDLLGIPYSARVFIGTYGLHITLAKLPIMSCANAVQNTQILNKVVVDWRRARWKPMLRLELLMAHRYFHTGMPGGDIEYLGGHCVRLLNWSRSRIIEEWHAGRLFDTVPHVAAELPRMLASSSSVTDRKAAAGARLRGLESEPWMENLDYIGGLSIVRFTDGFGHIHETNEIMDLCMWLAESLHNHIHGRSFPGWNRGTHRILGEDEFHMSFPVPFELTSIPSV